MSEDLIKREDAIKALRLEYPMMPMFKSLREEWAIKTEGFRKAEEVIMSVPSANRPQGEWIPCSERLPESQGYYICTCKDGSKYKRTTVIKWSNGWQLTGSRTYWVVVAWMPLPEPYGEREGE